MLTACLCFLFVCRWVTVNQEAANGVNLPPSLEGLPRAEHFPTQRHRWNTNEVTSLSDLFSNRVTVHRRCLNVFTGARRTHLEDVDLALAALWQ